MKKPIIIVAILALMAGVITTAYLSSGQKQKPAQTNLLYANQDFNGELKDPMPQFSITTTGNVLKT